MNSLSTNSLYLHAKNLRVLDRIDEALDVLAQLQQLHPRYSRLYEERGHCYAARRDTVNAIDAFREAVNINAALPASWQMLQALYQTMEDDENTARVTDRLATLRNLPPEIVQAAGLFADGELLHTELILRTYLAKHDEHIEAMRLLGRTCIARGLRDDAEALLEAVVEKAPDYRAARADYARALLNQQKYVRSRHELQRLLEVDADNRAYLRQYAEVCIRLGGPRTRNQAVPPVVTRRPPRTGIR